MNNNSRYLNLKLPYKKHAIYKLKNEYCLIKCYETFHVDKINDFKYDNALNIIINKCFRL